jgi:hypothetical protein
MPRAAPVAVLALAATLQLASAFTCSSQRDCSGAGQCVSGSCVCSPGFMGASCSALNNATPPVVGSGFVSPTGDHAWGSQVIKSPEDGKYHMLVSVYPGYLDFFTSWLTAARIAHAVSDTPEGPFTQTGMALDYGAETDWDRSVMNPKVIRAPDGTYLLFYVGDTYPGPWPTPQNPVPVPLPLPQSLQRIGVAYSSTPEGPYARLGQPILTPRADKWDARIVTNPAVTLLPNGTYLMIYKGSNPAGENTTQKQVCLGVATAANWTGPWVRARDDPIFPCPLESFDFEDPTVWVDPDGFLHLVVKDFSGVVTHDGYSGAHAISTDGVTWNFTSPALAYTTTHKWSDGVVRKQHYQERAQVLLDDSGHPLGFYFATDTGLNGSTQFWNMYMPTQPQ